MTRKVHDTTRCNIKDCEQCLGLRLYPESYDCEFCNTFHAGGAANCPNDTTNLDDPYSWDSPFDSREEVPTWLDQLCWGVFNRVRQMTTQIKENKGMLPKDGNTPQQSGRRRAGSGQKWLNNDLLSK